ncbi:MAG: 3'-5' exonuclease, partial [Oscillospiraceae bacterium]
CASRVNGIADGMVAAAPYIEAVMPRFLEFVGALPLVAHNAAFDMGFIRPYLSEAPRVYDTLRLSRAAFPGLRSYNLEKLCLALSIEAEGFHRALADVEATAELFSLCCKALSDEAVRV